MPKHKPHLEISQTEVSSSDDPSKGFALHRHDATSLSTLLIANSKHGSESITSQQQGAISRLETSQILDLTKNHRYTRVEILCAHFSCFDDLFFFGSLKSRCGLRFCFKKASEDALTGVTNPVKREELLLQIVKGNGYEKRRVVITIFLREREERSREEMFEEYQGTLLHEMIHAFLMCWACDYEGCSDAMDVLGQGHGPVCEYCHPFSRLRGFV